MKFPLRRMVTHLHRRFLRSLSFSLPGFLLIAGPPARADVFIENDRLTVTTANLTAVFRGPDLVRLSNRTTQEIYVNTTTPLASMLDMGMLTKPDKPLRWLYWHKGKGINANPDAAQIMLNDLTRTVWMNVIVDPETQDITVTLWGDSHKYGVTGLTWGIRGLDLSAGRLIIPAHGGRYADRTNCPPELTLAYPTEWEAQMAVWEGKQGGFVVYCRDDRAFSKNFRVRRKGEYADIGFETQAEAPFEKAGGIPQMEWRINTYRGDWRTPALGYRNLMNFYRKPVEAKGNREWVYDIRTVTLVKSAELDPKLLDALAKKTDPKKTLLYLTDWRQAGFDRNYPDYEPRDNVRTFIERAHELGFRVMLHASLGISPASEDYKRLQRYQVKDAETQRLMGVRWDSPDGDPQRYAYINPAAKGYRDLLIYRLRGVVDELQPDALHLQGSGLMWNDGNGPLNKQNLAQGSVALHRALLTTFPDLVLSADGMNELLNPYTWFAERSPSSSPLAPHPISAFLFSNHTIAYTGLSQPDPDKSPLAFAQAFRQFEQQGVNPSPVISSETDVTAPKPNNARLWTLARLWQEHGLAGDWNGDWTTALYRWKGVDGTAASLEKQGGVVLMKVGENTVYRRQKGSTQLVSGLFVPGWAAFDDGNLYGLDPNREYWLEALPRPAGALHLSSLSQGTMLTGAQVTPDYGLFQLEYARKTGGDSGSASAAIALPVEAAAVSFGGTAEPATMGAGTGNYTNLTLPANLVVFTKPGQLLSAGANLLVKPHYSATAEAGFVTEQTLDSSAKLASSSLEGVAKQAITIDVSAGRQSILSWVVKLPDSEKVGLSFAAGMGEFSTAVRFTVRINGERLWTVDAKESKWYEGSVDLSKWKGKTALVQLVAEGLGGEAVTTRWADVAVKDP
jgi:hypothetical protein